MTVTNKILKPIIYSIVVITMVLSLISGVQAATGNIDPVNKYAWGTNIGWLNFNPTHGGATVYGDHLEGYVWSETIGWIRLGTHTTGGSHSYGNTTKDNYGVNNDGSGNLSGYAWSTNAGWINFNPTHSQVTIDMSTGVFDGYAWGENIGWIHFKNASPAYGVVANLSSGAPTMVYLPLLLKNYPRATFPIQIGPALPVKPVTPGESFYSKIVTIPSPLPTGGKFYLSGASDTLAATAVDDQVVILLNGGVIFSHTYGMSGLVPAALVEVPRPVMEQIAGQIVTFEYRDVFGVSGSAGPVWLVYSP